MIKTTRFGDLRSLRTSCVRRRNGRPFASTRRGFTRHRAVADHAVAAPQRCRHRASGKGAGGDLGRGRARQGGVNRLVGKVLSR
jgi:hypothetical protein